MIETVGSMSESKNVQLRLSVRCPKKIETVGLLFFGQISILRLSDRCHRGKQEVPTLPSTAVGRGEILRRCADKKAVYKFFMILFPVAGLIELGAYFLGFGLAGDTVQYFYMNPVNIIFCISLAAAWTGVWYMLHEKFPNVKIGYLQKLSKHINNIYCIHWVMIGIACIIKEFTWKGSTFGMLPATLIAALFLVASEWIADWYTKKKKAIKA